MKKYKIPCSWQMYGYKEVEAENLKEAIEIVEEESLPDGDYIEGSFEIDTEILEYDYPNEEL